MAGKIRVRQSEGATGVLVLADGTLFYGTGFGAEGEVAGELCYNTAMTGYQEALTDPAEAGKIITFTFPHIGNTGANPEDTEGKGQHALGCVLGQEITGASNFRATQDFASWLKGGGQIAVTGVDTRAIVRRLRKTGAQQAVIAHHPDGNFDVDALIAKANKSENDKSASEVSVTSKQNWDEGMWTLGEGYTAADLPADAPLVVALDFGVKKTMLRQLVAADAKVTLVPPSTSFEELEKLGADGLFLSDGPGRADEMPSSAQDVVSAWLKTGKPLFGIGLGHRLLALAVGAKLVDRKHGHHGSNHPIKALVNNRVEIVSISQGEAVDANSLPASVKPTHTSLFDHSICGITLEGTDAFSVEFHPEASPGPQESAHLFGKFVGSMKRN